MSRTMDTTKIREKAGRWAEQFETVKRDETKDETYVRIRDNAPDKDAITKAVHAAHRATLDHLPEDWTYGACLRVLEHFAACTGEDLSEDLDSLVDIYTHDLTGWLHSHNARVSYIARVFEEFGTDVRDGCALLQMAQGIEYREIADALASALAADDADDDE